MVLRGRRAQQFYGYIVDDVFYDNKMRALAAARGDPARIRLYFCDDEWSNVDWTKEPPQSIKDLIDIRCRQLRDSFKHVSLFFSSGYDSVTILNSFLRNNLVIDRLIVWDRSWVHDVMKPEIDHALMIAKNLKNSCWPHLEITHWKMDPKYVENFYLAHRNNWIEHASDHIGVQKGIRNFQFESAREIFGLHEKKDHVVLEGKCKPRLDFKDGKWYAMMNDKVLRASMHNGAEQFYYSPHFPELYVKQCHRAIDWLEKNFYVSHKSLHEFMSFKVTPEIYQRYNIEAMERDPVPHHTGGAGGTNKFIDENGILSIESQRCKAAMGDDAVKIWQDGINEVKLSFSKAWDSKKNGLRSIISNRHYMRDFRIPSNSNLKN